MMKGKREAARSFELRYFSSDASADGETDFKGPTAVFNTEERLRYLRQYADYARTFFANPAWDRKAVSDDEVERAWTGIKKQPSPSFRQSIELENWLWTGQNEGKREKRAAALRAWGAIPGTRIREGRLQWTEDGASASCSFEEQSWRFHLQWRLRTKGREASLLLNNGLEVGCDEVGRVFAKTPQEERKCLSTVKADEWIDFRLEVDVASGGFNLIANDRQVVDFAKLPLETGSVSRLTIAGHRGMELDSMLGTGFHPEELKDGFRGGDVPFVIRTFLDEDFRVCPDLREWTSAGYNDAEWASAELPFPHGGERFAGEDLYLRRTVRPGTFERAFLYVECLDPGGEIWLNGKVVTVLRNRHPQRIDVTELLLEGEDNQLAVRVYPHQFDISMRHTSSDRHTGWFAGRMRLDLTNAFHIEDLFVYTRSIHEDMAVLHAEVMVKNDLRVRRSGEALNALAWNGTLELELREWFPEESDCLAASVSFGVTVEMGRSLRTNKTLRVPMPKLWHPDSPRLYKVTAVLRDAAGGMVDDCVMTTGIRTVSQEGGVFRVNGKAEMMNGALLFGYRYPIDKIAAWDRCGPGEWIVRDLLMLKKLGGNTGRMSHHNSMLGCINDPRYAELGDQLGIMFQWATSAWVRDASPWLLDLEGLPKYVRQVRNHPSIAMWQPSNHPSFESFETGMPWFEEVYAAIHHEDPSRLISPTSNLVRLKPRNDDGTLDHDGRRVHPIAAWTAPGLTRGGMDNATGYGAEWSVLRSWPFPPAWEGDDGWRHESYKSDFLASAERAYFDFENEESTAQPNWRLLRGKPEYRIKSYEWEHDAGSIGRELEFEEWELSQAWQAFSAYESIRKKRWLGYDGFAWCTLRGGGNNGTYMKPLTDYYGHGKMAFHAVAMGYQKLLAGSRDVDIVYGPGDEIRPVVMNVGDGFQGELHIVVKKPDGEVAARQIYAGLRIPPGKIAHELKSFRPDIPLDAYYAVEYILVGEDGE
ncbi:hypothetical protein [Paenibacillus sp. HB172176]|uniref:hypothetical protein n=1 Tax=Paenibacillus sp. HB172176 TaxID=2493690 RepID=UPI00143C23A5|nr:hypothetical protein [Paenibacillus sp. HB172176]